MRKYPLLFWLLTLQLVSWGQAKYSNEFLSIGVGARAQGMGNAVVAQVEDVTAAFWNPAGLAASSDTAMIELGAMHNEWFAGVGKYDYLGVSLPLTGKNRRLAFSALRFGIDNIPNTLSLYEADGTVNFDNLTTFSAADYAFFLSYGQELSFTQGKLLLGGNMKVIHRRIGPFASSWGFGLDLGAQYRRGNWQLGLMLRDIPSTFNAWAFALSETDKAALEWTSNTIPVNSIETTRASLVLGLSRRFSLGKIGCSPEINAIITSDGQRNTLISGTTFSLDPALGLELDYLQLAFLRLGGSQFQQRPDFDGQSSLVLRPSIGMGFRLQGVQLDYAFSDSGASDNLYSHVVSLGIQLKR